MNKIVVFFFLVTTTVLLGACSLNGGSASPTTKVETGSDSNKVNIQNFAFSPETLTVKKGTTVTWINQDSAPHQIMSDSFNSTEMAKGQSFSFTFNSSGSFDYVCTIHPSMKGKIIVE